MHGGMNFDALLLTLLAAAVVSLVFAGSTLVIGNNNQLLKVTLNAQGPISTAIA